MHKVKWMKKTCESTPAQWEGMTTDGNHIYIRYRFGSFFANIAKTEKRAVIVGGGYSADYVAWSNPTNNWAGDMDDAEMIALTKDLLDFSDCKIEKELTLYIFELNKEQRLAANPAISLQTGERVPFNPDDRPKEITADKARYIVDPNYKKLNIEEPTYE